MLPFNLPISMYSWRSFFTFVQHCSQTCSHCAPPKALIASHIYVCFFCIPQAVLESLPRPNSWLVETLQFTTIFSAHLSANVFCAHLIMIWFYCTYFLCIRIYELAWIKVGHICLAAQFKVVWSGLVYVYTTNKIDLIPHRPVWFELFVQYKHTVNLTAARDFNETGIWY